MEDGVPETQSLISPKNHEQAQGGGEEKAAGGFISHLISNLVSGREDEEQKEIVTDGKDEEKGDAEAFEDGNGERSENGGSKSEENVSGNGGGVIDLISNFFGKGEYGRENEERKEEKVQVAEAKKEKEDGGGGIIDSIVSHLPTSLPEDAGPTTDEASILIHSIIHD